MSAGFWLYLPSQRVSLNVNMLIASGKHLNHSTYYFKFTAESENLSLCWFYRCTLTSLTFDPHGPLPRLYKKS